ALTSSLVALTVINMAYLAEIIRAGVQSIPRGYYQAGLATGLTPFQASFYIVMPQVVRNMLPACINQLIYLFKISALVYVIGYIECVRVLALLNCRVFAPFPVFITAGAGYCVCCYLLSLVSRPKGGDAARNEVGYPGMA